MKEPARLHVAAAKTEVDAAVLYLRDITSTIASSIPAHTGVIARFDKGALYFDMSFRTHEQRAAAKLIIESGAVHPLRGAVCEFHNTPGSRALRLTAKAAVSA